MEDPTQLSGSGQASAAGPTRAQPTSKAVDRYMAIVGVIMVGAVIWLIAISIERAAAGVHHAEVAYSTLSLSRASIGDVGVFWGGYAAYASTCLFLFAWLARFPILKSLASSFFAALAAVAFVFLPLVFFAISVHVSAGKHPSGSNIVCGSWLYPSPSLSSQCIGEFSRASRYGLTVAVVGIVAPLCCMAFSVGTEVSPNQAGATTRKSAVTQESASPQDDAPTQGNAATAEAAPDAAHGGSESQAESPTAKPGGGLSFVEAER